jgi:hypothetical protein
MADSHDALAEELRRAGKAKEIFENEVFRTSVQTLEDALLDGIRRSAFVDEKLREKLCHRYSLLRDLLEEINSVMTTGKMASIQIEEKKRFKFF